jgi:hypothetical protein
MKVGDWVRSKKSGHYGLILKVHGGDMAQVLWQGMACDISWIFCHDLVFDVGGELISMSGN